MRVVIAPDKFKGSLSAPDVAAHLSAGLRRAAEQAERDIETTLIPVADGGEGTLDAAVAAGFTRRTATVTGPLGQLVKADFAVRGTEAVIEMATASGLALLPTGPNRETAKTTTSQGTGELIRTALDLGCRRITLGVGGSANNDGGAGLLRGLGVRFLDSNSNELPPGGAALARLETIDTADLDLRLEDTTVILASDVDNPLLGPSGAPAVFGPQKGATPDDVTELDAALTRFVEVLTAEVGQKATRAAKAPGAGAAGGVGYAALAMLNAERKPGIDVVLEFTDLEQRTEGADLVITGEGSLDEQSLLGKTPMGVARAAARAGIPVIAVCGRTTLDKQQIEESGFQRVYPLTELESNVEICMAEAGRLLEELGQHIGVRLIEEHAASGTASAQKKEPLNA